MSLLTIVLTLIILAVIFWGLWYLIRLLPFTSPDGLRFKKFLQIALIVFAAIVLVYLAVAVLGGWGSIETIKIGR